MSSDEPLPMLQGKFPELRKMSKQDKDTEITAWRNLWGYVPSEVKGCQLSLSIPSPSHSPLSWLPTTYYLLKSGTAMAITMRNYKRHMGVLLSTRWDLKELEMGVYEREYDQNTGEYFMERKIIKLNPGGFIDLQWIQERTKVQELVEQCAEEVMETETARDDTGTIAEE